MKQSAFSTALALVLVSVALSTQAAEDKRKPNPSSHAAAFFEELLTGRAFVYTKPYNKDQSSDESDRTAGVFFGADGKAFICTRQKGSTKGRVRSWRIIPSGKHRTVIALHKDKDDPANHRYQQVPFYDGESGRLHIESWSPRWRAWRVWTEGWVQESWPRVLAGACKKLKLPPELAINEKQTEKRLSRLKDQDSDAALVRFRAGRAATRRPRAGASRRNSAAEDGDSGRTRKPLFRSCA